ncbi:MAG: polysaccharide biosynthesis/export family protein [Candidatus Symbiothrix sp.]|jgi:polysaccharide export outer membrane protein|nr:polysaccharide biosynthesis/export family protein [Candidatus Symbiothrix sp.]
MKKKSIGKEKHFYILVFTLFSLILMATSCGSKKDILYFQDIESFPPNTTDYAKYQLHIVPNDNLLITVSALNPMAAEPFNSISLTNNSYTTGLEWKGYLVDNKGEINFPVIGKVALGGLTKSEAEKLLEDKISNYLTDKPVVNIRFMNYKISIFGEVNKPGTYTITDERVSLPEMISLAGDLTIYGQRRNVRIYRMENGEKKYYTVDLTNPAVFYSPYYYLQQNDIVYVEPNKARAGASTYNQSLPLVFSAVSILVTVASLVITLNKK